ncbi:MAG: hypothetical protein ACI9DH_000574 [Halioglobus sp.]|jgi:hypothetical protein
MQLTATPLTAVALTASPLTALKLGDTVAGAATSSFLLLEDGSSFLLFEDNTSKVILG